MMLLIIRGQLILLLLLLFGILLQFCSSAVPIKPRYCNGAVRHVHISVGPDPSTSMIVSFASIPSKYEAPVGGVLIGKSPDLSDAKIVLETEPAVGYSLMAGTDKWHQGNDGDMYVSPYYHHVMIRGLDPSTTYYYRPAVHDTKQDFEKETTKTTKSSNKSFVLSEEEMEQAIQDTEQTPENERDAERRRLLQQEQRDAQRRLQQERELDIMRRLSQQKVDAALQEIDLHGNYPQNSAAWEDERELVFLQQRERELISFPPYDPSERECTSPERIRSFQTAPPPAGSESVNLAVIGDLGQFIHSEETFLRLQRDRDEIDAILLVGDIAYTTTDHRRWDTFFDFLDDYPIVDNIPLQICPGNHDIDKTVNGDEIFLAYEHRFRMPRVKPAELGVYDGPPGPLNMDTPPYPLPYEWGNAYYSFIYGPAKVIMMSAYSSMEPGSQQYEWIQKELKSVDRSVTPWVLAILHTPMYNTFWLHRHDVQIVQARKHLEPLFVKYKANFVLTGHIHAYQRTAAVAFDEVVPTGPVHITVGAGGRKCEAPFRSEEPEPWALVRDATWYGYGMLRILNHTTAVWDWIHTGHTDLGRTYNQVGKTDLKLPPGPSRDHVVYKNQFYM